MTEKNNDNPFIIAVTFQACFKGKGFRSWTGLGLGEENVGGGLLLL